MSTELYAYGSLRAKQFNSALVAHAHCFIVGVTVCLSLEQKIAEVFRDVRKVEHVVEETLRAETELKRTEMGKLNNYY